MNALHQLTVLLNGIESGRMNVRWINNTRQYLLDHEEGIELILQYLQPHVPYLDVEETLLPIWDGLCQAHPEMLDKFLDILAQEEACIETLAKIAGHGPQPISFLTVEKHLAGRNAASSEQLGRRLCHTAVIRAIYSPQHNPDNSLLCELLGRKNATSWLSIREQERPLPWVALWASCVDPADGVAIRAIEVLDVLMEHGASINDLSPDKAQCWALENLCHRYSAEPLAIEVLVEALLDRGANSGGLTLGPVAKDFLDQKMKTVG